MKQTPKQMLFAHLKIEDNKAYKSPDWKPFIDLDEPDKTSIHVISDKGIYKLTDETMQKLCMQISNGQRIQKGISLADILAEISRDEKCYVLVYRLKDRYIYVEQQDIN